MKNTLTLITLLLFFLPVFAQEGGSTAQQGLLPPNPEPGKCYVRCIPTDIWTYDTVRVVKRPAYTEIAVMPKQEYRVEQEVITVKGPTVEYVARPPVYDTIQQLVIVREALDSIVVIPARLKDTIRDVMIESPYESFEYRIDMENCNEDDPRRCLTLCYVQNPAKVKTYQAQVLVSDASIKRYQYGGDTILVEVYKEREPARIDTIQVGPVMDTIVKQVRPRRARTTERRIEAEYITEIRRTRKKEEEIVPVWEEVLCKYTDFNVLPIYYDYDSDRLLPESQIVIDTTVLSLMKSKPLLAVEIDAHTDSRGHRSYNEDLSQRRAQSVVDYLVSRGIRRERLIAKGFGETKLLNECRDGVNCSEEKHRKNRRTEFRVVSQ